MFHARNAQGSVRFLRAKEPFGKQPLSEGRNSGTFSRTVPKQRLEVPIRTPKPWYRRQTDTWYVCLRGKQIPLAKGKRSKREADEAFHRLMAMSAVDCGPPAQAAKDRRMPSTHRQRKVEVMQFSDDGHWLVFFVNGVLNIVNVADLLGDPESI